MSSGTTASIKGVLYKSATGTPIEGAIVMIAGGSYEHITKDSILKIPL